MEEAFIARWLVGHSDGHSLRLWIVKMPKGGCRGSLCGKLVDSNGDKFIYCTVVPSVKALM